MKEDGAHSGHSRAAGLALVDVRAARDSGEPVEVILKNCFLIFGQGPQFLHGRRRSGTRCASGFGYWEERWGQLVVFRFW